MSHDQPTQVPWTGFDQEYVDFLRVHEREFRNWMYGSFPITPQCSVQDGNGRHCPGAGEHEIIHNGKRAMLCDECKKNYDAGAYRDRMRARLPQSRRL